MSAAERSTARLLAQLQRAFLTAEGAVLYGNTADVFVGPNGNPCRLPYLLAGLAADSGRGCVVMSLAAGARQLPSPGCSPLPLRLPPVDTQPGQAAEAIVREVTSSQHPVLIIFDWAELYLPANPGGTGSADLNRTVETLGEAISDPAFSTQGHRVIVIGRTDGIDERLLRLPGLRSIEVPLPNRAERLCFIERLCRPDANRPLNLAPGLTTERLATLSGGLLLDDLLRARDEVDEAHPLDLSWVQTRKTASLARSNGDNLTVYPPGNGMATVAGLPQVRRLINECRTTGRAPLRILLAGPPGVGKTLVVRAIADELGLPAVALGQFRSRYVGDSERNLRRVLSTVEALSPCVLHVDELDQAVGQRNTGVSADGGTSERIFAELLTFLGDNQRAERVTVIATSNRPDVLDSAMFDRFTIIPVLHPTPTESVAILEIGAEREGRRIDIEAALRLVGQQDQLLTGRVLVEVLERAMTFADLTGQGETITEDHLKSAFADLLMALDPVEHELLALDAIRLCTFRSYLPWVAAEHLGERPHVPPYLNPLLDEGGELQLDRLTDRLALLKGATHAA